MLRRVLIFSFYCSIIAVVSSCSLFRTNKNETPSAPIDEETMSANDVLTADSTLVSPDSTQKTHRTLTLREQMQHLSDKQDDMNSDLQAIKKDLAAMKLDISDMKKALLKKGNTEENLAGVAIPGDSTQIASDSTKKPDSKQKKKSKDASKLLPDESKSKTPKERVDKDISSLLPDNSKLPTPGRKDSTAPKAPPNISEDYKKALQLVTKKQYPEAIELLEKALQTEKNPINRANENYWLGECHFARDEFKEAIPFFKETLKNKSSTKVDDAMILMAESYLRLENKEEAKKIFEKLIQTYPQSEFVPRARKMLQML